MSFSVPVCPVPAEQQPINEYQELRESWFFRWATLNLWSYLKPIFILWGVSWLISAPVAATSFTPAKHSIQFFLFGASGAMIIPTLALVRLYLGWVYVRDRLAQPIVFYEESGWYDGQVWTKPDEVLQRDRLIVTYQIQSILQRLKLTFGAILLLFLVGSIIWQFSELI
ncbi:MAG: CGLD27 family protein [Cyanobacteria bacterium CRU_2_1]|nr:CGLD27 family protein [Cyanobacteria bacterium RU_5_0]NJR57400.1 CGLD27 family protein [Cyanobacteria bacterium CRU_2_1]